MILIPEQISYLRNEIISTRENIKGYRDYLDSKDITSGDYSARALIGDSFLDDQYGLEREKYREIMYTLEHADYQKTRNTDQIAIGTKFKVRFNNDRDEDELILVEAAYGISLKGGFVSLSSILGQNIIGKKEGETFTYTVQYGRLPHEKRTITATITSISKDPKDYTNFINEKRKNDRISKKYKAIRHELLTSKTTEAQKELEEYETITPSQRFLLLLEAERLGTYGKDRAAINRMTVVKKLLETAKVVCPLDDGTIKVGKKFELVLDRDGEIETIKAEMINHAVSDELDSDYIERISPLGMQIYGLRTGETFTFREGNKVYKGCVSKIETQKEDQDTIGYQYHK
jgi:transcription elongation GreA/GreB family factor